MNVFYKLMGAVLALFGPAASWGIATLHFITFPETGYRAEGRVYGDDGVLSFGTNFENPLTVVEAVYKVLVDRSRTERNRDPVEPFMQVRH